MSVSTSSFEPRPSCARCLRPERLCYCAHLPALATRTRVVILQHPRERRVAIGTARMASLCIAGAELHVGARWSDDALARILGQSPERAALLYPGQDATDLAALGDARPRTLVVVDGTWSHAKNVVRASTALAALPRLTFVPHAPSEYRIRREPREDYVSTIEALAHVLGTLEDDPARFAAMLAPFRAMIDAQIEHASRLHAPRARRPRGVERKKPPVPEPLLTRRDALVCVSVESSAWPHGTPERAREPHGELVHLVAERVEDGRRLDRVVRTRGVLAPGTTAHAELDADTLAAGTDGAELLDAWRQLVGEGDVVVHWGTHAVHALRGAGLPIPERLDLRLVFRMLENRRTGTPESLSEERGLAPRAAGRGRAGRRAAAIADLARALAQPAPR